MSELGPRRQSDKPAATSADRPRAEVMAAPVSQTLPFPRSPSSEPALRQNSPNDALVRLKLRLLNPERRQQFFALIASITLKVELEDRFQCGDMCGDMAL